MQTLFYKLQHLFSAIGFASLFQQTHCDILAGSTLAFPGIVKLDPVFAKIL